MRFGRGARQAPVSVSERWRQMFKAGQAELHGFTVAQLAAVSLQDGALPAERGPVLHAAAVPAAEPGAGDPVADLERQGYVRPWPPAAPDGPIAEELPGWAEAPGEGRRQVALAGDLAIIASTRARPAWIAEVSTSTDPAWPEPEDTDWVLTARVYARYTPPVGLLEFPDRPDGAVQPHVLLPDDRVLATLVAWCGGGTSAAPPRVPAVAADTSDLADRFTRLTRVSVVLPDGDEVRIRNLITASGDGGPWLLEGRHWEQAVPATADDLGRQLAAIVRSAAA
jgi:hypothetical protein